MALTTSVHQVVVTNTGGLAGDCVVLAFVAADGNYKNTNRDQAGIPQPHCLKLGISPAN